MLTYHRFRVHLKRTLQIAVPVVISQIGHVAVSVADSIMVGQIGAYELAGCSLGISLLSVFTVFGIGLANGITPIIAQHFGAKRIEAIRSYFNHVLVYSFFIGLLLTALVFSLIPLFNTLSYNELIKVHALAYLYPMSISLLPLLLFLGLKQFYEGLGNTKVAMMISIAFNLLNILLNYVLIFGHLGFEPMGVYGAGLATLISRILMAVSMVVVVARTKKLINYIPKIKLTGLKFSFIKNIAKLGIPGALQYVFEVGAFGFAAFMVGYFGAEALAAHQIAINIASVTYMMATGLSMGASVLAAQAFGRNNVEEVKLAGNTAFFLVGIFMFFTALLFVTCKSFLAGLYTSDAKVLAIATPLLIIASIFQMADGVQAVGIGLLRGLSDVKKPTFYTFLSYWVICLPLGYVLAHHFSMGVYGIWAGLCAGLFVAAITLVYRFKRILTL